MQWGAAEATQTYRSSRVLICFLADLQTGVSISTELELIYVARAIVNNRFYEPRGWLRGRSAAVYVFAPPSARPETRKLRACSRDDIAATAGE